MNPLLAAAALTSCFVVALRGLTMVRDRGPARRLVEVSAGPTKPRRSLVGRFYETLSERLAPRAVGMMGERQRAKIRRRLDAAGRPGGMTLEGYAGRKASFVVVLGGAGVLFLAGGNFLVGIALIVLGWVQVDMWLSGAARRRQGRIDRDLPDFLDILSVTVAAGVGFRPAIARVSDAIGGPLGEEMTTALRQMDLGYGRRASFGALKERNQSESLHQFVNALIQAEELGVPLADALGNLADDMRRSFYQAARRRAARAAPRVSLIVSIVIVPATLILIVAAVLVSAGFNPLDVLSG